MSVLIRDVGLSELSGVDIALGAGVTYLAIKPGFREATMICDTAWRLALCPRLVHALYYETSATSYTEYVSSVVDGSSSTHMPLDAMATNDIVYLGVTMPALGFYFDVGSNVNANAATLDVEYCSTAMSGSATIAFTDVASDSDGTTSGGATLAQDGAYTFTLPSVKRSRLGTYGTPLFNRCYWYRFLPSATLSATVDINEIIPIYQTSSYGYMSASTEYTIPFDVAEVGGIMVSGTETKHIYLTWIK